MFKPLRRWSAIAGLALALIGSPFLIKAQTTAELKAASVAAKITPDLLNLQPGNNGAPVGNNPRATDGLEVNNNYVIVDGAIAIEAVANDQNGEALLAALQALGLREGVAYRNMIFGFLPLDQLASLKDVGMLNYARPYYTPETNVGRTTSQGDRAMKADLARQNFGVTGAGTKVGVISDSYNATGGAPAGVTSDDLPANVQVIDDYLVTGATDEGRAMAEIVHDVAPGAAIAFNTANRGQAGFAKGIIDLANAGCNVIVDDVIYFAEPFFQDGIIAQAVDQVVVNNSVTYFSSAGNQARSSYQAAFSNSGINYQGNGIAHNFGNGDIFQKITIPAGGSLRLALQWDDPFRSVSGGVGAKTDLDIYVFRSTTLVAAGSADNLANGDPVEVTGTYTNRTTAPIDVEVVIVKYAGPDPNVIKWVNFGSRTIITEYDTRSGASYGHSSASRAIAVGATPYYNTPVFNANVTTAVVEGFSSAGGTPIFFNTAGQRINGTTGITRQKPEITAVDGGNTTFFPAAAGQDFEGDGFPNFFGTSAAAPHAAAVAALMQEKAGKKLTPANVLSIMQQTAMDMDDPLTPGFDTGFDFRTGYGFIQADKALQAIAGTASLAITSFTCNYSNSVLTNVDFVVGYPNGTFTPAIAPLLINGVTGAGQLGVKYNYSFDNNQFMLPIKDMATNSTYFVWNFRDACNNTTPVANRPPVFNGVPALTGTVGEVFRYTLPPTAFTDPDAQPLTVAVSGLPASLSFDATTRVISGTLTAVGSSTLTLTATDPGSLSVTGTTTLVVSATTAPPAQPASITVTSFTCNYSNSVLTNVDFVVGYPNGTFTPAIAPLLINGVTGAGQLGVQYNYSFDNNQFMLPIKDMATNSTYFIWNFRVACNMAPVANRGPVYNGGLSAQTGAVGVPFSYTVPATAFTDPDGQPLLYSVSTLPTGLTFNATTRVISGTPTAVSSRTVTVTATDPGALVATGTLTITISATATPPVTVSVTSFSCNYSNSVLSNVDFVVGYSNGTFTPALPPLFINGVTGAGQLGVKYNYSFDNNQSLLEIRDQATRSLYYTWNFRAACPTNTPARLGAEPTAGLRINALGNPVRQTLDFEVTGAEGQQLNVSLTDAQGRVLTQQRIGQAGNREQLRFNVGQHPVGVLLLRATTPTQSKVIRVLKVD